MASSFFFSFFFLFFAIQFSSSSSIHKLRQHGTHRYCGTKFLIKSEIVLRKIDRSMCNESWPVAEWYELWPKSVGEFTVFCCKIGCNIDHFKDFMCLYAK